MTTTFHSQNNTSTITAGPGLYCGKTQTGWYYVGKSSISVRGRVLSPKHHVFSNHPWVSLRVYYDQYTGNPENLEKAEKFIIQQMHNLNRPLLNDISTLSKGQPFYPGLTDWLHELHTSFTRL